MLATYLQQCTLEETAAETKDGGKGTAIVTSAQRTYAHKQKQESVNPSKRLLTRSVAAGTIKQPAANQATAAFKRFESELLICQSICWLLSNLFGLAAHTFSSSGKKSITRLASISTIPSTFVFVKGNFKNNKKKNEIHFAAAKKIICETNAS